MLELNRKLFPFGITDAKPPVRIACLDTGIDANHHLIRRNWAKLESVRDHQFRDFFEDQKVANDLASEVSNFVSDHGEEYMLSKMPERVGNIPFDTAGHGTHLAGIYLQVVPHAGLFSGRVFDRDEITDDLGDAARRVALVSYKPWIHSNAEC